MQTDRIRSWLPVICSVLIAVFAHSAAAKTLCVKRGLSPLCFATIQSAVNAASPYDIIIVAPGVYKEYVTVGKPVSLLGAGNSSIIDATDLAHGIFVDGFDHPGLRDVIIAGLTVRNAQFEGILAVNTTDVIVRDSSILDNDKSSGLEFTGATMGCPDQPGNGVYENDETGDCGGAVHLIGVVDSTVSGNFISGNADGVLISDETGESRGNLLINNAVKNNPLECGIVLASHPRTGTPPFGPHYGVDNNTVSNNVSTGNGVQIGGSGVGLFSDGNGPGRVSGNVVVGNTLTNNGLGGVALHTHAGPSFGAPADDMSGNVIIDNYIAGNLADTADTATPGTVGININSGGGGSPVLGTVISHNTIRNEDVDVAINTPAPVNIHVNNLLGGKTGVADVCAFDKATACTGTIDATENYWGCLFGPGARGCSTISGSEIRFVPWLLTAPNSGNSQINH